MKTSILCMAALAILFCSCNKTIDSLIEKGISKNNEVVANGFTLYTIKKGEHSASQNAYRTLDVSELKFAVRFDSTAIYQTVSAINQYDINKLYGFSDNNSDHHQSSARFGWRWSEGALRLFAYAYSEGVLHTKEITTLAIGAEANCSIRVQGNYYEFSVNDMVVQLPRSGMNPRARGYQLYPYFGGDERAPHDIQVWIRKL